MFALRPESFAARFIRSLLPSAMSALLCICSSVGIVGTALLLQSVTIGTSLPGLFEGEWATEYTNNVVQPLESAFSSVTAANIMTLLIWGGAGLVVYLVIIYGALSYKQLRNARRNIQLTENGTVIQHPALHSYFVSVTWRVIVVCIGLVVLVFGGQSTLESLSRVALSAVEGGLLTTEIVLELLLLIAKLTLLAHICVVFTRLVAMRSRLF